MGFKIPSLVPLHSFKSFLVGFLIFRVFQGMFVLLNDLQNRVFLLEDIVLNSLLFWQIRVLREKGYFQPFARDYLRCIGRVLTNKDF